MIKWNKKCNIHTQFSEISIQSAAHCEKLFLLLVHVYICMFSKLTGGSGGGRVRTELPSPCHISRVNCKETNDVLTADAGVGPGGPSRAVRRLQPARKVLHMCLWVERGQTLNGRGVQTADLISTSGKKFHFKFKYEFTYFFKKNIDCHNTSDVYMLQIYNI